MQIPQGEEVDRPGTEPLEGANEFVSQQYYVNWTTIPVSAHGPVQIYAGFTLDSFTKMSEHLSA